MKIFVFPFSVLFFCYIISSSISLFAQGTVQGCIYNGRIYVTPNGDDGNIYYLNKYYSFEGTSHQINYNYGNPAIGHIQCTVENPQDVGPGCRVRTAAGIFLNTNRVNNATLITCLPLDDYIPILILILGVIGFFYINSKKSTILIKC
ncbi:hypothetical protein [Pedobacter frigiditerrae]|uniref:hypothetical protein n=1 Tax=Pedobacter frigiditerrae TaxID=2530452 RepID=UPI00292CD335|nr:hypothetical protein [Pedobacter frigiditerrae]